jgi:hypothetical protein
VSWASFRKTSLKVLLAAAAILTGGGCGDRRNDDSLQEARASFQSIQRLTSGPRPWSVCPSVDPAFTHLLTRSTLGRNDALSCKGAIANLQQWEDLVHSRKWNDACRLQIQNAPRRPEQPTPTAADIRGALQYCIAVSEKKYSHASASALRAGIPILGLAHARIVSSRIEGDVARFSVKFVGVEPTEMHDPYLPIPQIVVMRRIRDRWVLSGQQ